MKKNSDGCLIFVMISICLFFKCGVYSFSGSTLPPHIRTVGVPLFENQTPEFSVDQQMTDALIEGITEDNSLQLGNPRNADALLKGNITNIKDAAGAYDQAEVASDFRVTITIQVEMVDMKKKKTLWQETFTQWGQYDDDSSRETGLQQAMDKLTEDILNRTVSGW